MTGNTSMAHAEQTAIVPASCQLADAGAWQIEQYSADVLIPVLTRRSYGSPDSRY